MSQRTTLVQIPQPCHERWEAMTPTTTGRHCAACQKTVVDFTLKTDAEILAHLARASGEICGRLGTDQLNRPLQPPVADKLAHRWPAWLVAVLAAGWLNTSRAEAATAPAATTHFKAQLLKKTSPKRRTTHAASRRLRGTVRDAATQLPIAGVAVFLKGENRAATTDSAGQFSLRLPGGRPRSRHTLVVHFFGYHSENVAVPAVAGARPVHIRLRADPAATQAEVVGYAVPLRREIMGGAIATIDARSLNEASTKKPVRSFWRWLTQPFRTKSTS
jgi:hypothetical protein